MVWLNILYLTIFCLLGASKYRIFIQNRNDENEIEERFADTNQVQIDELKSGTQYLIKVQATSSFDRTGDWSSSISVITSK